MSGAVARPRISQLVVTYTDEVLPVMDEGNRPKLRKVLLHHVRELAAAGGPDLSGALAAWGLRVPPGSLTLAEAGTALADAVAERVSGSLKGAAEEVRRTAADRDAGASTDKIRSAVVQGLAASSTRSVGRDSPKTAEDYYDQNTSPLKKRKFLRLAREGAFQSRKVGKQILVLRSVLDTYIANQQVHLEPRTGHDQSDEAEEILARAGLRVVKP